MLRPTGLLNKQTNKQILTHYLPKVYRGHRQKFLLAVLPCKRLVYLFLNLLPDSQASNLGHTQRRPSPLTSLGTPSTTGSYKEDILDYQRFERQPRAQDRLSDKVHLLHIQFSSVAQSCPSLCDPINHSTSGLPVYHQLPEFTQIHVH